MQVSYNTEVVDRLREEDPDILPTYTVDSDADLEYNKSQINSAIESAIIEGKSVDEIAEDLQKRLESVNEASAIRTARTAITSAQNSGRLEGWYEAREKGVNVQKQWIASLDDRTRESHANLDHEIQELEDEFSNGLQYPGDPSGDPSEVYNCRCTMKGFLPDYDTDTDDDGERFARDPETGEAEYVSSNLTYADWLQSKTGDSEQKTGSKNSIFSFNRSSRNNSSNNSKSKNTGTVNEQGYDIDNLHPEELAGVQRTTDSMSFSMANSGRTNPKIDTGARGYKNNCQSCVVANEARRRGYDVSAKRYNLTSRKVSKNTNLAWIDPNTGTYPAYITSSANDANSYYNFLELNIKQGERYTLEFDWKCGGGHIVNIERRPSDGKLRIKDNQRSLQEQSEWIGKNQIISYLRDVEFSTSQPMLLRIDNMEFNEEIVNKILKAYK